MKKKYFWVMKDFIKLVLWFSNWKMIGQKTRRAKKKVQRIWVGLRSIQKTTKQNKQKHLMKSLCMYLSWIYFKNYVKNFIMSNYNSLM
jgi:hypothetical protein